MIYIVFEYFQISFILSVSLLFIQFDFVEYFCVEIYFKFLIVVYLCLRNGVMLSVYLFFKKFNNLDCINKEKFENVERNYFDINFFLIFS